MTTGTRPRSARSKRISIATAVVCIALLKVPALLSQSKPDLRRFTATVSVGVARPADQWLRELYGVVQYPLFVQADFEFYRHVLIFAGFGYVGRTGRTQAADPTLAPAGDPIRFRMNSVKLGLLYTVPRGRVTLLGGGGAGFHYYQEKWDAAGVTTTGREAGFIAQAGVDYSLTRSLSLVGRVDYSRARVTAKSAMENDVNLGRFEVSLGLSLLLSRLMQK